MADGIKVGANQALIMGRVEEVTALENGGFDTAIALPAADQYSSPSFMHVYSDKRIGQKGETVQQLVDLRGFRQRINGNKGVWVKYTNTLRAVQ
ncbi:hypothetical protein [Cupriavidus campinensis]|uniref:Uncharacterized protein n=1 Tax=Cupriavidus campinensis TaxID=151783 RepID=A0AAE9I601_9BURK|nr:hypothetical protein [Cupriavidus campinensis]URF08057.1 hypothetical protein M5D45_23175 [Cupriavidus campinensis]